MWLVRVVCESMRPAGGLESSIRGAQKACSGTIVRKLAES
jgi:hypothetical protein